MLRTWVLFDQDIQQGLEYDSFSDVRAERENQIFRDLGSSRIWIRLDIYQRGRCARCATFDIDDLLWSKDLRICHQCYYKEQAPWIAFSTGTNNLSMDLWIHNEKDGHVMEIFDAIDRDEMPIHTEALRIPADAAIAYCKEKRSLWKIVCLKIHD